MRDDHQPREPQFGESRRSRDRKKSKKITHRRNISHFTQLRRFPHEMMMPFVGCKIKSARVNCDAFLSLLTGEKMR
jgi:hypothetical protein